MLPQDLRKENAELRKRTQTQAARIKELEQAAANKPAYKASAESKPPQEKKSDKPAFHG